MFDILKTTFRWSYKPQFYFVMSWDVWMEEVWVTERRRHRVSVSCAAALPLSLLAENQIRNWWKSANNDKYPSSHNCIAIFIMWSDTLLIVGISVFTALLGEGFTWLLVYRTEKYTRLKQDLEKQASVYIAYIIGVALCNREVVFQWPSCVK